MNIDYFSNKKIFFLYNHFSKLTNLNVSFSNNLSNEVRTYFKTNKQLGAKDRKFLAELIFTYYRYLHIIKLYNFNNSEDIFIVIFFISKKVLNNSDTFSYILKQFDEFLEKLPKEKVILVKDFLNFVDSNISKLYPELFSNQIFKINEALFNTLNSKSPITIRLLDDNNLDKLQNLFKLNNIDYTLTNLNSINIYTFINFDTLLSTNNIEYEIQDNGSIIISKIVADISNNNLLDACAGSGGKSLAISSFNKKVKIDMYDSNINRLNQYYLRNTNNNVNVLNSLNYDKLYDLVLVDSPCSGSGTIRRHPDKIYTINENILKEFASKQINILNEYSKFVKKEGILVYVTCSLFDIENIEVVNKFLENNKNFIPFETKNKLLNDFSLKISNFANILLPINYDGDIFFVATMKRIS